jgi:hypothetical protein
MSRECVAVVEFMRKRISSIGTIEHLNLVESSMAIEARQAEIMIVSFQ